MAWALEPGMSWVTGSGAYRPMGDGAEAHDAVSHTSTESKSIRMTCYLPGRDRYMSMASIPSQIAHGSGRKRRPRDSQWGFFLERSLHSSWQRNAPPDQAAPIGARLAEVLPRVLGRLISSPIRPTSWRKLPGGPGVCSGCPWRRTTERATQTFLLLISGENSISNKAIHACVSTPATGPVSTKSHASQKLK